MKRAALLSVSDRKGLIDFARGLNALGYELLCTSGTGRTLSEQNIPYRAVELYTGQAEMMDGRVKTLHPRIHAGLLARRDIEEDMRCLQDRDILPIDVAAVNLYPFCEAVGSGKSRMEMIELIDVGGPAMIRAAAKNFRFVLPVIDPADYAGVLAFLQEEGAERQDTQAMAFREGLAVKVFTTLAYDNLQIASYFSGTPGENGAINAERSPRFSRISGAVLEQAQPLRYGENPHQAAAFYLPWPRQSARFEQLSGRELSYNNLLDADAARRIIGSFAPSRIAVAIVKHLNPCGAAYGGDLLEALQKAKRTDPRSHFGGIIACNAVVTPDAAREIRKDFAEIVLAPQFEPEALDILRESKNLRILRVSLDGLGGSWEMRTAFDGVLLQEADDGASEVRQAERVAGPVLDEVEFEDLDFAWRLCAHVKSNAIVLARQGMLIGVGAGQTSRVDAVSVALMKARCHGHQISGAVAASDAFFPFPDSVDELANAGIRAIVVPRGSKRDPDTIEAATKLGASLLFVPDRHFRH